MAARAASEVLISAAVMCHPRRRASAQVVAASVGKLRPTVAEDPKPNGQPTSLRSAIKAWRELGLDATHHLVLQDDISVSRSFVEDVTAAVKQFTGPLAFYANWNSWNGSAVRMAAASGAAWVGAVTEEYVPTLALLLPRVDVDGLVRLAESLADSEAPDDQVVQHYMRLTRRQVLISVPNLVEHGSGRSVAGNDFHGVRQATCFADAVQVADGLPRPSGPHLNHQVGGVLPAPDVFPQFLRGVAYVIVAARGLNGTIRRALPWKTFLLLMGIWHLIPKETTEASCDDLASTRPDAGYAIQELWGAACTLGLLANSEKACVPLVNECLRTLVLGGFVDSILAGWATSHLAELSEVAQSAFAFGSALRRDLGELGGYERLPVESFPPAHSVWRETMLRGQRPR